VTRRAVWLTCAVTLLAIALAGGDSACESSGSARGPAVLSPGPGAASSGPAPEVYAPGRTYVGRHAYVEFRAGDLPIVLSAPHGGSLEPAELPDRTFGTTVTDIATADLAQALANALRARTGREPSLVVCRLKRTKIDVNRDIGEGAQGHRLTEQAWQEYHAFLDAARARAARQYGRGLLVDLHGHGHPKPRVEIGYLIGAAELDRGDARIDEPAVVERSSIRTLAAESGLRFSALLRGAVSLGGLLEQAGYPSVPAPLMPSPGTDPYFEGGYITRRHASADGGLVSAVQIETPYLACRDTPAARARFAASLADALVTYLAAQFHLRL
jgi:hypothetical protein